MCKVIVFWNLLQKIIGFLRNPSKLTSWREIWNKLLLMMCALKTRFIVNSKEKKRLLEWVCNKISCEIKPTDFSDSWKDGIFLCALIEGIVEGSCPRYDLLHHDQAESNLKLALHLIEKNIGIKPRLTTDDFLNYDSTTERKLLCLISQLKLASAKLRLKSVIHRPVIKLNAVTAIGPEQECIAKGMGLMLAVRGRKAKFSIFLKIGCMMNIVIEIRGPNNTVCSERITNRSPKRRIPKEENEQEKKRKIPFEYDIQSGKIVVGYTPLVKGEHKLSIIWQGQHIMGSPYTITVDDAKNIGALTPRKSLTPPLHRAATEDILLRSSCKCTKTSSCSNPKLGSVSKRRILRHFVIVDGKEIVIENSSPDKLAKTFRKLNSCNKECSFEDFQIKMRTIKSLSDVMDVLSENNQKSLENSISLIDNQKKSENSQFSPVNNQNFDDLNKKSEDLNLSIDNNQNSVDLKQKFRKNSLSSSENNQNLDDFNEKFNDLQQLSSINKENLTDIDSSISPQISPKTISNQISTVLNKKCEDLHQITPDNQNFSEYQKKIQLENSVGSMNLTRQIIELNGQKLNQPMMQNDRDLYCKDIGIPSINTEDKLFLDLAETTGNKQNLQPTEEINQLNFQFYPKEENHSSILEHSKPLRDVKSFNNIEKENSSVNEEFMCRPRPTQLKSSLAKFNSLEIFKCDIKTLLSLEKNNKQNRETLKTPEVIAANSSNESNLIDLSSPIFDRPNKSESINSQLFNDEIHKNNSTVVMRRNNKIETQKHNSLERNKRFGQHFENILEIQTNKPAKFKNKTEDYDKNSDKYRSFAEYPISPVEEKKNESITSDLTEETTVTKYAKFDISGEECLSSYSKETIIDETVAESSVKHISHENTMIDTEEEKIQFKDLVQSKKQYWEKRLEEKEETPLTITPKTNGNRIKKLKCFWQNIGDS